MKLISTYYLSRTKEQCLVLVTAVFHIVSKNYIHMMHDLVWGVEYSYFMEITKQFFLGAMR